MFYQIQIEHKPESDTSQDNCKIARGARGAQLVQLRGAQLGAQLRGAQLRGGGGSVFNPFYEHIENTLDSLTKSHLLNDPDELLNYCLSYSNSFTITINDPQNRQTFQYNKSNDAYEFKNVLSNFFKAQNNSIFDVDFTFQVKTFFCIPKKIVQTITINLLKENEKDIVQPFEDVDTGMALDTKKILKKIDTFKETIEREREEGNNNQGAYTITGEKKDIITRSVDKYFSVSTLGKIVQLVNLPYKKDLLFQLNEKFPVHIASMLNEYLTSLLDGYKEGGSNEYDRELIVNALEVIGELQNVHFFHEHENPKHIFLKSYNQEEKINKLMLLLKTTAEAAEAAAVARQPQLVYGDLKPTYTTICVNTANNPAVYTKKGSYEIRPYVYEENAKAAIDRQKGKQLQDEKLYVCKKTYFLDDGNKIKVKTEYYPATFDVASEKAGGARKPRKNTFEGMTVKELKQRAIKYQIKGVYKMTKSELIEALRNRKNKK